MYQHTQRSPLHILLYVPAAFMFFVAWQLRNTAPPSIAVLLVAVILVVLAFAFQTLTVSTGRDHLDVRYGPLNLFGTRIYYRDITGVEPGKTSLIDGWGIHFVPFRGWTMNLWGFDCVRIERGTKVIRIGTDDTQNLVDVLRQKVAEAQPEEGSRHDSPA
jgi:hypothetical protein